jgi:hypothetical protein
MTDQKGQSLLEFLILTKVIFLGIALCSVFFYLFYAKQVSSYFIYKGLFCLESINKSKYECKAGIEKSLTPLLFFHKNIRVHTITKNNQNEIYVTAKFLKYRAKWIKKMKVY